MCRLLFLSWHTWGRGGACPDSSVSSSCSVPDPGSLQLFYSKGLERALPLLTLNFTLPTSQPGSDLSQWSMDWNTERLGISSKKLVREIRGTWALGQEEGPFAPGPLPRPGELRLWECKACARLGHTGSFVLPPPPKTSLFYPLPPNPPEDTVDQLWREVTIHTPKAACRETLQCHL